MYKIKANNTWSAAKDQGFEGPNWGISEEGEKAMDLFVSALDGYLCNVALEGHLCP